MSWIASKLGDICDIARGGSPRPIDKFLTDDEDGINWIKIGDATRSKKYIYETKEKIKKEGISHSRFVNDGDFLLSNSMSFGRPYIMRTSGCIHDGWLVLSNYQKKLDINFFYYLLSSPVVVNQFKNLAQGSTVKNLNKELVSRVIVKIPPLPIQQKIVGRLDAIFAEIDIASAVAEANANNAEALFKSYLNEIFKSGNNDWEIKTLNEISINLDSKRVPVTKDLRKSGDVPYYGASGIVDYVSEYLFDEDILLVSEDGANLLDRNYPIAFSVSGKSWVNNHAHVLKFESMTSQKFVEFYLNSISLKPYVSGMAQPKLNQGMLNKIPIPFPNIKIQKDLVNDFEVMKENRTILLNSYIKKNSELASLKQAFLQKAFSGELDKDWA